MITRSLLCAAVLATGALCANAYEGDVHYGLTKWLALQAGFDAGQAEWIAKADQNVDGGSFDSMELVLDYACGAREQFEARAAQRDHYPSARQIPARAERRATEPGSAAARQKIASVMAAGQDKRRFMLIKFGEALHTLQDSFAHQGIAAEPSGPLATCDPDLFLAHPAARGGANSHDADLTSAYPEDALAMARATFEALQAFGSPEASRAAASWSAIRGDVEKLLRSSTKAEKHRWFAAHGIDGDWFLADTSLPDGAGFLLKGQWQGRLPELPEGGSKQHDADPALRAFFDGIVARWIGSGPIDRSVLQSSSDAPGGPSAAKADELVARLKLWKVRDHGSVASLAHSPVPLTRSQLVAVKKLEKRGAFIRAGKLADAVTPLQPAGPEATPLLPYIVRPWPRGRFIAILRFRHAPHDAVGLIAERSASGWFLADIVSAVND